MSYVPARYIQWHATLPKTPLEGRDVFYEGHANSTSKCMPLANNMNSKCAVLRTSHTSWTRVDLYILLTAYIMQPSNDIHSIQGSIRLNGTLISCIHSKPSLHLSIWFILAVDKSARKDLLV